MHTEYIMRGKKRKTKWKTLSAVFLVISNEIIMYLKTSYDPIAQ